MKCLLLSANDIRGGAARAAYRLHRGLNGIGVDSKMLVQKKESDDPSVITTSKSKIGSIFTQLRPYFNIAIQKLQKTNNPIIHSANFLPSNLPKKINESDVDIIHLHWINGEMISIKEIAKINKPIVWTLHDMWAFSGAEHYDDLANPERYKKGYLKNNRPNNYSGLDIDRWTWNRKMKYWRDKDLNIVTPSNWLANCVQKSKLLSKKNIQTIPNGLNLAVYKPIPKGWAREILNIPKDANEKFILFGALSATNDDRKGYKPLKKALSFLKGKGYRLLVFGSEGHDDVDFGLPTSYLGKLNDDVTLALAYSSADVMIVPSLQDNLPNTAVESIACGTPVVAFNTGGLPDIIDHRKNGYLASAYDPEDLANGIKWIIEDEDRNKKMGKNAREKAKNTYDIDKVAERYLRLYKTILSGLN